VVESRPGGAALPPEGGRVVGEVDPRTLQKWLRIHRRRVEHALYQYSLGVITAGAVMEELQRLKEVEEVAKAGGL